MIDCIFIYSSRQEACLLLSFFCCALSDYVPGFCQVIPSTRSNPSKRNVRWNDLHSSIYHHIFKGKTMLLRLDFSNFGENFLFGSGST